MFCVTIKKTVSVIILYFYTVNACLKTNTAIIKAQDTTYAAGDGKPARKLLLVFLVGWASLTKLCHLHFDFLLKKICKTSGTVDYCYRYL